MSSTDAYLFYGLCWEKEDHFWPWQLDEEGVPLEEDDRLDAQSWCDEHPEAGATVDEGDAKIGLGTHCSTGCQMGYAAVASTFVHAPRGYPVQVGPLTVPDDAETHLRAFCTAAGYDYDTLVENNRLGWWLCSDTDAF